ncbi:uncharacterized protein LOC117177200 [Belonocnema kinseyi]|uniref:uncharacterized protein LOC117177200 n=1 Tax=Belonocnema kinseyi TaxID=2817044 RepID=UPI00143DBC70|nr:uncharacterized protein LOC117177200 [Belonocnema kinseyi]
MPNVAGPRSNKRKTLMAVVHSIMLYRAEVWADAMKFNKYHPKLASVQRKGALRVKCAYRTVSKAAILLLAGIVPINLLATERVFQARKEMKAKKSFVVNEQRTWGAVLPPNITAKWSRYAEGVLKEKKNQKKEQLKVCENLLIRCRRLTIRSVILSYTAEVDALHRNREEKRR